MSSLSLTDKTEDPFHQQTRNACLEHQSSTLGLLVTTEFEVLATLERKLCLCLALCALQSQHDLLGCLRLLVEDGLGLTTVTGLLAIVTALSLGEQRGLRYSVSATASSRIIPI
jgi:hypothetical protein